VGYKLSTWLMTALPDAALIWVMKKLMTMNNMNITLGYRRRGINAVRFPDDVNNAGVVEAAAGQAPFVDVATALPTAE